MGRFEPSNEGRNCASSKAPFVIDSLSARMNDDHAPLLVASVSPWRFHNPERRKIVFLIFFCDYGNILSGGTGVSHSSGSPKVSYSRNSGKSPVCVSQSQGSWLLLLLESQLPE